MRQHWRWLTFLHWRYPVELIQARLPAGLTVDTLDGTAWVGLVPFLMDGVRVPVVPPLPGLVRFPETNVRTYVRGPDGRPGVWFLSLDASPLPIVAAGRGGYGLRYCWSSMSVQRDGSRVSYRCRRRWPAPRGARCDVEVELGAACRPAEVGEREKFLTDRLRLYSTMAGRLVTVEAEHPPWALRRVVLKELRQDLIEAAGLPTPDYEPVLHAADGVPVRLGRWRPADG